MLLRPFGAMNGFRGGALVPPIGFGTAGMPSKGATEEPWGSPRIGTTGAPGVWAAAVPDQPKRANSVAAAIRARTPQAPWRIPRRAYGRLVFDGAEAARADPRSELPHQPLHSGLSGR